MWEMLKKIIPPYENAFNKKTTPPSSTIPREQIRMNAIKLLVASQEILQNIFLKKIALDLTTFF